jgi:hypothetical protein
VEAEPVSIAEVARGPRPPVTAAAILKRAYEAAASQKLKHVQVPNYGEPVSELWLTFRFVADYDELRESITRALKRKGFSPARRDVQIAIETFKCAAVGSYAVIDGVQHDIGAPLGLELFEALGRPGGQTPANDDQAIALLFHRNQQPSTTVLMSVFADLDVWMKSGGVDAESDAAGESLPAMPPA